MKRLIAIIMTIAMLFSFVPALADVDLSDMTTDELIALHEQVQLMLFEQMKSVTVPQGIWLVGKDIPAGTYLIRCADLGRSEKSLRLCYLLWGTQEPNVYGVFPNNSSLGSILIYNPNSEHYVEGQTSEFILTLEEGYYISVDSSNNRAVFYQYTGTPSFSFDW